MAIGLSIAAGNDFPDSIGPQIMLIITATTFIVQILGPICVKYGVTQAGEVGLNVTEEDIRKKTLVKEITVSGKPICSSTSYAIVNEDDLIGKTITQFAEHENMNYEVRGRNGLLVGQISLARIKDAMQIGAFANMMPVFVLMEKATATCLPETPLPDAYQLFADYDTEAINIVDAQGKPMGILEKYTVDHYIHTKIVELEHKLENMG